MISGSRLDHMAEASLVIVIIDGEKYTVDENGNKTPYTKKKLTREEIRAKAGKSSGTGVPESEKI